MPVAKLCIPRFKNPKMDPITQFTLQDGMISGIKGWPRIFVSFPESLGGGVLNQTKAPHPQLFWFLPENCWKFEGHRMVLAVNLPNLGNCSIWVEKFFEMFWIPSAQFFLKWQDAFFRILHPFWGIQKKCVFIFYNSPFANGGNNPKKKKIQLESSSFKDFQKLFGSIHKDLLPFFRHPFFSDPRIFRPPPPFASILWVFCKKNQSYMSTLKGAKSWKEMPSTKGIANRLGWNWSRSFCWILCWILLLVFFLFHLAQFRVPWAIRNWLPMMFRSWT